MSLQNFALPISIGQLQIPNRMLLAPLAGVSDAPFRRICQEMGAGLTYVEMLSATAILHGNKRTFQMMYRHESEKILGVQVTGSTAEQVSKAVAILHAEGFDTIDINMGCPVRKVVTAGCGSAILKDPSRVSETVAMSRIQTNRPLSAKFRLGYTRDAINVTDTAARVVQSGVDMFTIHGRTRSESYGTPVDIAGIQQGFLSGLAQVPATELGAKGPVAVGNGDIFKYTDALRMSAEANSDAVMVSRGALGNPWLFKEIALGKTYSPLPGEWLEVVLRHIQYHRELYGETRMAAVLARKHLLWYCKGFPGTKALREQFNTLESLADVETVLTAFVANLPTDLPRFHQGHFAGAQPDAPESSYDPKYEMDRTHDRGVGDVDLGNE